MKIKIYIKCILFCFIGFLILNILSNILQNKTYDNDKYNAHNYYNFGSIYSMPLNQIDVAYLGTSNVLLGINPLEIWNKQGITGYVAAAPVCSVLTTAYRLEEIFKYQTPKVVVIDVGTMLITSQSEADLRYAFDTLKPSHLKTRAMSDAYNTFLPSHNDRSLDSKIIRYFNLLRYHGRWDALSKSDICDFRLNKAYLKGFSYGARIVDVPDLNASFYSKSSAETLEEISIKYMDKIKNLCDTNGAEVLLVKIPTYRWHYGLYQAVKAYAEKKEIPYLDLHLYLDDMGFDEYKSFYDYDKSTKNYPNSHLNYIGAEKVSVYLGNYLANNYKIENKRNDVAYVSWNEDYERMIREGYNIQLNATYELKDYLKRVFKEQYLVCISLYADNTLLYDKDSVNDLNNYYLGMGLENKTNIRYAAIIDGGEIVFEALDNQTLSHTHKLKNMNIYLLSEVNNAISIKIDGKEYSSNKRGLNIVVVDKNTNSVIDSVVFDIYWGNDAEHSIVD